MNIFVTGLGGCIAMVGAYQLAGPWAAVVAFGWLVVKLESVLGAKGN